MTGKEQALGFWGTEKPEIKGVQVKDADPQKCKPDALCEEVFIDPEKVIPLHRHKTEEGVISVVIGKGVLRRGDEDLALHPGVVHKVSAMTPHAIRNTSSRSRLVLFVISTPVGVPEDDTEWYRMAQ